MSRDRLIETVKQSLIKNIDYTHRLAENITDDILANGVIVPPVKIGQTVYRIRGNYGGIKICKAFVSQVNFYHGTETRFWTDGHPLGFTADDIGKTVFLTKEQAEKALKERSEG